MIYHKVNPDGINMCMKETNQTFNLGQSNLRTESMLITMPFQKLPLEGSKTA